MIWPLFILLIVILQIEIRFSAFGLLKPISHFLHELCLNQIPTHMGTATQSIHAALVCGENLKSYSDKQLYTSTGLIHLFVVSGSHLILVQNFLEQGLLKFRQQRINLIVLGSLSLYAAMCLFSPPVARSLIYLFLTTFLKRNHRYWPRDYILLISGLGALAFNYLWVDSLSLQMSWIAVLVLELFSKKFKHAPVIFRQITLYICFIICYMGLGFPQISVILVCVIITPILDYILFPIALFSFFIHAALPIFYFLILSLNTLLSHLEFSSTTSQFNSELMIKANWFIILLVHFWLFFRNPKT